MTQIIQNPEPEERRSKRGCYRQWPEAKKRQIVAETYAPGTSVSMVARRHNVNANQVFRWRQLFGKENRSKAVVETAGFIPLEVIGSPGPMLAPANSTGMMTIKPGNKIRVRVGRDVDADALVRILTVIGRLP